jgi:hypothetical protein
MRFSFFALSIFLPLSLLVSLWRTSPKEETLSDMQTFLQLTQVPRIALSEGYLEEPFFDIAQQNRLFPSMKNYSRMDFVYAK